MSQAIVVDDLQFAWPDGEVVFEGLSFVVGPGRTGLIGANGSGKSTYRGALLVASHDLPFLRTIGITRWLRLEGRLTPIDPP